MLRHLLLSISCLIYYLTACNQASSEVVIIKTKSIVLSYESAVEGIKSVVDDKIVEYDMEYKPSKGRKILNRIKKLAKRTGDPSVIFTIGHLATKLTTEEITDIPVIFCMVVNPSKYILNKRSNVGGVSFDVSPKPQLIRLKDIVPSAKHVGVIYDPKNSANIISESNQLGLSLDINIIAKKISSQKEIPDILQNLINKVDVLWIIPDSTVLNENSFKFINLMALRNCIPVMACSPQLVELGSPFSFFSDAFAVGQQAGNIYKKVINGGIKGNIPIEYPKEVFLAINIVTMKRCGIEISENLLKSARHIYK